MSFTAITYQPRPSGIVREKHLSENLWIKKVTGSICDGHLDLLDSTDEIFINRKIKKAGKNRQKVFFGAPDKSLEKLFMH